MQNPNQYPTQAFAVKRQVYKALSEMEELAEYQVYYSDPVGDIESVAVFLGSIKWDTEEAVTNRGRRERYSIDLFINIQERGSTALEMDERLEKLFGLVEGYLRDNPVSALGRSTTLEMKPIAVVGAPNPDAYEVELRAEIVCTSSK